jgi:hypothetical protein
MEEVVESLVGDTAMAVQAVSEGPEESSFLNPVLCAQIAGTLATLLFGIQYLPQPLLALLP